MTMKIEVRKHKGYEDFEKIKKGSDMSQLFGKFQYIFTKNKKEIDLILIKTYRDNFEWEIYSNEKIFEDVERFQTKEEAFKKICDYLKEDYNEAIKERIRKLEIVENLK